MEDLQGTVVSDPALAHAEAQRLFGAPPVDEAAALREARRLFGNPLAPAADATAEVPPITQVGLVPSHLARAAPSWFPAETIVAPAPPPAAVEAPPPPEECTYEGVTREDGAWVADIKIDGEIKRIGTFATAGAAGWAYDAAREERGLPPVNFPLPGQAPAPVAEAPAPAEDEEAVPPVTTDSDAPMDAVEPAAPGAAAAPDSDARSLYLRSLTDPMALQAAYEREQAHQLVAAPPAPAPPSAAALLAPARKPHVATAASTWAAVCTDLLAAVGDKNGIMGMRGRLVSCGFRCSNPVAGRTYFDISVPLTFPCYYDVAGRDYTSNHDVLRSKAQLTKYFEGCLALAQAGGAYRTEADREADEGEDARRVEAGHVDTRNTRPSLPGSTKPPVARRAPVPRRAKAVEPAPAAPQVALGASGFRNVQKPRTPGGVWSTSVTIEGSRTSAGSHTTKEDAARAVDALLLAHGKPAVNFPGEEEVSRAAFPDITKAKPRAGTPSRKRPRPDDDATAAENERLRRELERLRTATQSLEKDLRASEANVSDLTRQRDLSNATAEAAERRADRYGQQRDEARGDAKRLRRERDEARKDAASSERALAALRQKLDRQISAQHDIVTPARPAKRGRHHYSAEEPVDEPRDAAEAEEDASPRQVQGADDNARASSDSDEAGDQSFPVGSWVRHATTGAKGVVIGVSSCEVGVRSRSVLCVVGQQRTSWGLGQLQHAPGAPPAALAAVAAARSSKRGDWVRDEQTGKKGVIVEIIPKGRRTILCDNDEELKRTTCEFRIASGAPPAALVAKAASWRKTAKKKALPPPPPRKRAAAADAESSEEEDDEASFPVVARPSPVEPRQAAPAAGAAHYPVETLVEARFRRGDVFYPALVVAVRDGGRTLDLKYTDGDSEERVPLEFVRPLAARQRSAPAAAVPAPPPDTKSKPRTAARWTAEEEKQLRELVNELGENESWSVIAARLGSHRSASACEWHWKDLVKGRKKASVDGKPLYGGKACEVRRGSGPWRRFASQADAFRKIPALDQSSISGLINESRDGRQRQSCSRVRGEYEARDYFGDDFEAAKPVARWPPPAAPAEDAIAPSPTSSVSYPVDTLVEARWRGGSKYYPALVLADNGQTIHVRYCDDSDEEETIAVSLVRPANRRLLQRYEQVTGKRPPPNLLTPPPPPPAPSSPRFAKGSKCIVPWSDGRKYAATVVSAGPDSARVEFEDGATKTVPLEELEPLNTHTPVHPRAETSQQIATGDIRCTSGRPDCYCKSQKSRAIVSYDPETGAVLETYCSVGAAADKLGVDVSTISHSLAGRNKAAGHAFRYRTPLPPPRTKKIPEALPGEASPPPPPPPPPLPTDPCAICMSTITEDACVLACGHAYHARCLGDLADHVRLAAPTRRSLGVSCPLCRKVTRAGVGTEEA